MIETALSPEIAGLILEIDKKDKGLVDDIDKDVLKIASEKLQDILWLTIVKNCPNAFSSFRKQYDGQNLTLENMEHLDTAVHLRFCHDIYRYLVYKSPQETYLEKMKNEGFLKCEYKMILSPDLIYFSHEVGSTFYNNSTPTRYVSENSNDAIRDVLSFIQNIKYS